MGYRIQYSLEYQQKYPPKRNNARTYKYILTVIIFIVSTLVLFRLHQTGLLKELLIPGDAAVTEAAMETLSENLRNGLPFNEAITAFCIEIFENGNVY